MSCKICKEQGKQSDYWGESSRDGYRRGLEHSSDLRNLNPTSHMVRHLVKSHQELDLTQENNRMAQSFFKMQVMRKFTSAMDRQLGEALAIARDGGIDSPTLMNGCDEYNLCVLPELMTTAEVRLKERAKRARDIETQEITTHHPRATKRRRTNISTDEEQQQQQEQPTTPHVAPTVQQQQQQHLM